MLLEKKVKKKNTSNYFIFFLRYTKYKSKFTASALILNESEIFTKNFEHFTYSHTIPIFRH